jgi:uncharacterized protein (TIGR02996 family)
VTERELHAAILADPAADAPRLVYADWLLEHGDEARGELIVLQCSGGSPERQEELLVQHGRRWTEELAPAPVWSCRFARGMIEHVAITSMAFLEFAEHLFARTPLASVKLTRSSKLGRVLESPFVGRLTSLEIYLGHDASALIGQTGSMGWMTNAALPGDRLAAMILASTQLVALRELRIKSCTMSPGIRRDLEKSLNSRNVKVDIVA